MKTWKQKLKKVGTLVLALAMVVTMVSFPTKAEAADDTVVLYLSPWEWSNDNAKFAVYLWADGKAAIWREMTYSASDAMYKANVPSGYTGVVFCRKQSTAAATGWDGVWNQTEDLGFDGEKNCYTITSWNKGADRKSTATSKHKCWNLDFCEVCHKCSDTDKDGYCDNANCKKIIDNIGAKLAGYTLSLDGNIGVNFYMELTGEVAGNSEAYAQITYPGGEKKVTVAEAVKDTTKTSGKTYHVFSCEVAAKDMEGEITLQMHDGENEGTPYTYTVKEYADAILAENSGYDEKTKVLAKAMLTYGEYAKNYFGDKTLAATEEIEAVKIGDLSTYAATVTNREEMGYYGSSLLLKSEVILRHYFTKKVDGATATEDGNFWYIDHKNIAADKLGIKTTTTVGNCTIEYSPLSYAYAVLNGGSEDESLKNLVKALYLYNEKACAYKATPAQ